MPNVGFNGVSSENHVKHVLWNMYCFLMSPPSLFPPLPWELQSGETPNRLTTWTVACPKRSIGVDQWLVGLQYHAITYCAWLVTCQWLLNHSGGPCAPWFLFSTVARLTNKQMSPDLNIPSKFNSNDFMNFFTDKIDNIRNTITNVDSTASSTPASFIAPKEKLQCFTTIGQDELNKLITASKPTTCLLDPVPTKLLKELLPVAEQPLLNIINSSLSLGHVPKQFKLAVIKPLIKKPKLDPCELANYRPISNLPFMSKILEKVVSAQLCSFLQKKWYLWRISVRFQAPP